MLRRGLLRDELVSIVRGGVGNGLAVLFGGRASPLGLVASKTKAASNSSLSDAPVTGVKVNVLVVLAL